MVVGLNDKSGATKVAASQLLSTESRTPSPSFGRILKKKKKIISTRNLLLKQRL